MGKFALECPKCGTLNTASTFILAKKVIKCGTCSTEINVKQSRMISKKCDRCEKVFVWDQAKSKSACPACGNSFDATAATAKYQLVTINCPQCACSVEVRKDIENPSCPVCDCVIDVSKEIAKQSLVNDSSISVIQYEGDNSTFVWKHPIEDFNLGSILNVHESQEAIFFSNGEAFGPYGKGQHILSTENLPILKKIYDLPTGSQSPFHAEVYFINKTIHAGLKWGTDSRVNFIDPITNIPFDIGANGTLDLQVCDSRKLLIKLVGTVNSLKDETVLASKTTPDGVISHTLPSYFKSPLMTIVKSNLARIIRDERINILEIDSHLDVMSEAMEKLVSPRFEEYGIKVVHFYISHFDLPTDNGAFQDVVRLMTEAYTRVTQANVNKDVAIAEGGAKIAEKEIEARLKLIQAQTEAEITRQKGYAEADVMRQKGVTGKDYIDLEAQKAWAEGIGKMGSSGGTSGGGAASGIVEAMAGFKMAEKMFDKFDSATSSNQQQTVTQPTASTWVCPSCGESLNTKNFCMNCGSARPTPNVEWVCPQCGDKNTKRFCSNCGFQKN